MFLRISVKPQGFLGEASLDDGRVCFMKEREADDGKHATQRSQYDKNPFEANALGYKAASDGADNRSNGSLSVWG